MRFGTRGSFKSVLAARAAAMLAFLSLDAGDRVGGVILSPFGIASHRPQRSRARVLAFVKALADGTAEGFGAPPPAREPSLSEGLTRLRQVARPGTLAFLISDFHDLDASAAKELGRISLHARVANLLVFDPLEAQTPPRGLFRVSDGLGVGILDANSRRAREAYAARFAQRREALEELSHLRGMSVLPLETGTDPADAVASLRGGRRG